MDVFHDVVQVERARVALAQREPDAGVVHTEEDMCAAQLVLEGMDTVDDSESL